MKANKPRHNPMKPQNRLVCPFDDGIIMGHGVCEKMYPWYCDGDPHKCKSARYKYLASLSEHERDKFNENYPISGHYTNLTKPNLRN